MSNKREDNDKKLFDNIASQYVKKDLTSYCRISRKLRLIQSIKDIKQPIKNILEVGCGAGFSAEYLKGKFIKYTGIDYSENLIKYAIEHNNEIDVHFQCLNINQFETKKKFDVVLMIGVLHHMPNPKNVIKSVSKLLKSDGIHLSKIKDPYTKSCEVRNVFKELAIQYNGTQVVVLQ